MQTAKKVCIVCVVVCACMWVFVYDVCVCVCVCVYDVCVLAHTCVRACLYL
jgi:hypothetical protein